MSEIPITYPGCGHDGKGVFRQSTFGLRLVWSRSYACPVCGAIEEDGDNFPPEDLRQAVLEKDGYYKLVAEGADRLAAIKVIRGELRYPMETSTILLRHFPVIYVGTQAEARWLKAVLADSDLASCVAECETDPSHAELAVERLMSQAARQNFG